MSFLTLWQGFLSALASFLMTEPIDGFVGIFILMGIVGIFKEILNLGERRL